MSRARRALRATWPRLAAVAAVILVWWAVAGTDFFDDIQLPTPADVGSSLWDHLREGTLLDALSKSLIRLAFGLGVALLLGTLVGIPMAVASWFRASVGSLVAGLHSLPSIAWLPVAVLWFGLTERAIVFVVFMGAFPAVAMGTAASLRQVSPLLVRAGRTLGLRGWRLYRRVVLPAAVPGYVAGLQQGWAFAWWSLMAGELIATGARGLGHFFDSARQRFDTPTVLATMAVIFVIGMLVDLGIGALDRRIRARRGLVTST